MSVLRVVGLGLLCMLLSISHISNTAVPPWLHGRGRPTLAGSRNGTHGSCRTPQSWGLGGAAWNPPRMVGFGAAVVGSEVVLGSGGKWCLLCDGIGHLPWGCLLALGDPAPLCSSPWLLTTSRAFQLLGRCLLPCLSCFSSFGVVMMQCFAVLGFSDFSLVFLGCGSCSSAPLFLATHLCTKAVSGHPWPVHGDKGRVAKR